jgi:hypothetical protein
MSDARIGEPGPVPRNLVLARVGARSLHPDWIASEAPRGFDLRLVPYEPLPDALTAPGVAVGDVVAGPKWTGLREALRTWDGWREYDAIWMPDDDLDTTAEDIDLLFDVAAGAGLDLFAPALDDASHYAHFDTRRNPRFFGRRTGFVEIMMPGFSRAALERLQPTFDESETGWGWGLDSVWPKILNYENLGVVDAVAVTHTRPVGAMRDEALRRRVVAESDRLLAKYGCGQVHATFAAFDADLRPRDLSADELTAELVEGWAPLIDRDPRVRGWIDAFQRGDAPSPPYPTEGTPTVEATAVAAR